MRYEEFTLEGRNAVIEAYRAGKTIDKLFVLEHCKEGSMNTVLREAKKHDTVINYVKKERLDQMSETGKHQGVIGYLAAYEYATVDEILDKAREKGCSVFNGLYMLLYQGAEAFYLWTGKEMPTEEIKAKYFD